MSPSNRFPQGLENLAEEAEKVSEAEMIENSKKTLYVNRKDVHTISQRKHAPSLHGCHRWGPQAERGGRMSPSLTLKQYPIDNHLLIKNRFL